MPARKELDVYQHYVETKELRLLRDRHHNTQTEQREQATHHLGRNQRFAGPNKEVTRDVGFTSTSCRIHARQCLLSKLVTDRERLDVVLSPQFHFTFTFRAQKQQGLHLATQWYLSDFRCQGSEVVSRLHASMRVFRRTSDVKQIHRTSTKLFLLQRLLFSSSLRRLRRQQSRLFDVVGVSQDGLRSLYVASVQPVSMCRLTMTQGRQMRTRPSKSRSSAQALLLSTSRHSIRILRIRYSGKKKAYLVTRTSKSRFCLLNMICAPMSQSATTPATKLLVMLHPSISMGLSENGYQVPHSNHRRIIKKRSPMIPLPQAGRHLAP